MKMQDVGDAFIGKYQIDKMTICQIIPAQNRLFRTQVRSDSEKCTYTVL